jgi:hypothetical protein
MNNFSPNTRDNQKLSNSNTMKENIYKDKKNVNLLLTLEDYSKLIKIKRCRWCDTPLPIQDIDHYPHQYGWTVRGFDEKQWLSVRCPKCRYEWSLWKLGVPREKEEIVDEIS